MIKLISVFMMSSLMVACASDGRSPASSRAGRAYEEPRAMNHRSLDTETLYQACLRERPETSCRNRMGR